LEKIEVYAAQQTFIDNGKLHDAWLYSSAAFNNYNGNNSKTAALPCAAGLH